MLHVLKIAIIAMGVTILASGCAVKSRTEVEVPGVRVETGSTHSHGYKHCPPGHAKKGWC